MQYKKKKKTTTQFITKFNFIEFYCDIARI